MLKTTMVRQLMMRRTPRSIGSPVTPAHSSINAFHVALRVICIAAVLLPSAASSALSPDDDEWPGSVVAIVPESLVSGDLLRRPTPLLRWFSDVMTSPRPHSDEDEWPGSVVAVVSESRPVNVTGGGLRQPPEMISPLPFLWFTDVRDVTRSPRPLQTTSARPNPIVLTNRSKGRKRKTKTKKPKNKRNRNGKKKKIVLKNKIIVKLEDRPKIKDSPPSSSSSPPPTTSTTVQVSKIEVQKTVPRCIANDRFIEVLGLVKSLEFQLAVAIVIALLLVVIAICRCWTSWTRRLTPFHVFP